MKACCGFGHRYLYENIEEFLKEAILNAIEQGCETFYTGAMGEFDNRFSSEVRRLQATNPKIKLVCVKPYFTADFNENRTLYDSLYDDIVIPPEIIGMHFKAAIKARNCWMIDNSDLVICYLVRDFEGAFDAIGYAKRQKKVIVSNNRQII